MGERGGTFPPPTSPTKEVFIYPMARTPISLSHIHTITQHSCLKKLFVSHYSNNYGKGPAHGSVFMCFFALFAHTPLGTKAVGLWWRLRSLWPQRLMERRGTGGPGGWALSLVAQFPRFFTHLLRCTRRSRWHAALLPLIPRWGLVAGGARWARVLTCCVWSTSAAWLR